MNFCSAGASFVFLWIVYFSKDQYFSGRTIFRYKAESLNSLSINSRISSKFFSSEKTPLLVWALLLFVFSWLNRFLYFSRKSFLLISKLLNLSCFGSSGGNIARHIPEILNTSCFDFDFFFGFFFFFFGILIFDLRSIYIYISSFLSLSLYLSLRIYIISPRFDFSLTSSKWRW